jgi:hypothetical protein
MFSRYSTISPRLARIRFTRIRAHVDTLTYDFIINMQYCMFYFSYNYLCIYIYVLIKTLNKVSFSQSFYLHKQNVFSFNYPL